MKKTDKTPKTKTVKKAKATTPRKRKTTMKKQPRFVTPAEYGKGEIETELDTFFRVNVVNTVYSDEWFSEVSEELNRLAKAFFPQERYNMFNQVSIADGKFIARICFKDKTGEEEPHVLNCEVPFDKDGNVDGPVRN